MPKASNDGGELYTLENSSVVEVSTLYILYVNCCSTLSYTCGAGKNKFFNSDEECLLPQSRWISEISLNKTREEWSRVQRQSGPDDSNIFKVDNFYIYRS